jgi:hypothetical protein
MASTSVVLPWSTCATIATLRRSFRTGIPSSLRDVDRAAGAQVSHWRMNAPWPPRRHPSVPPPPKSPS